ncbi:MAG: glycosyltransferase [Pseudonocardia sp.]
MDIVYLHQYYGTPEMQGGIRSYEFSRRLVEHGHRVHMIAAARLDESTRREGSWWTTEEAGVTVHWCGVPYSNHMGFRDRVRAFGRFAVRASVRATRLPADLVFATSTPLTIAVPGGIASRRLRVPMVFEVRDVWPEVPIAMGVLANPVARRVALALESWAYRSSAAVIALSPDMARSISTRFPTVPVTVVPNSSDLALFAGPDADAAAVRASRPWLGRRPLLLYAGTFGDANDVGYLVRVAQVLRSTAPEVRVLLVGEGRARDTLERRARDAGVWGRNLFVEPPVAKRGMPELFAAADLCASVFADVPALSANSPNKVFDAFAAGRPVVINNGGWLAEVLDQSGAGFAVPAADPADAAAQIARRIQDPEWLARAGAAAAELARGRFNRDLLFETWERVLLDAAERGGPSTDPIGT